MKGKGPVESEGFMNALSSQAAKMKEKKRKISKQPKALSLVSKTGSGGVVAGEADSPTPTSAEPQEPMDTGTPTSDQKGEEGSKRKKKVSWAEDSNLVMVHYFEMDESERAINREQGSFLDAAQREKTREREARESGLMFIRDRLIEMISWQRPQRNESVVELVNYGINSEQRKIQAEREEKVLAQLFLSKSSLHPSPAEPDAEPDTGKSEPKHIPLMEPTVDGQQQSSPTFSSPPHQVGGAPPPPHMTTAAAGSPLQSPAATIHQAQSLINSFNDGKGHMPPDSRPHPPGPPDQNSFHPPPGPHPPPNFHGNGPGMMPPSVGTGDFYNNYNQQGFPPGVHNPDWNGPMTGGYYGDYGGGAPPIRRGMRGGYRGRGRGFSHGYGKGIVCTCQFTLVHNI
ncbi:Serine/threonine-protein phosphatase 1 regulatory subunit 10 [Geodia barretti]|uniref:Serine/threonine-protein phosphatase 1 regulatory subunit 10 n=1 Tax=Geodia barretti TaxID=519541 RepID=A0AA35TJ05_GEOBA|nr:Serine/threonine-protein phosphatase 1 regulatory subunit 10 [Geodia barretti]